MALQKFLLTVILEKAINGEELAFRFYDQARETALSPEVKKLLKKLCAAELKHRLQLQRLRRRGEKGSYPLDQPIAAPVVVEEAWTPIGPEADIREVMAQARINEQTAQRYYTDLAQKVLFRPVRDVLLFLASEEAQHVRWIEKAASEAGKETDGGKG